MLVDPVVRDTLLARYPSLICLEDASVVIEVYGKLLSVYRSPRTPHHGSGVFQYECGTGADVRDSVPASGTDILVTHGLPS